jgi:hypothetical protein
LALPASDLAALLEMTNRRRTGGVLALGAFGLLLDLLRDALFGVAALRFNINYQTKKHRAGSEIMTVRPQKAASDDTPAFIA